MIYFDLITRGNYSLFIHPPIAADSVNITVVTAGGVTTINTLSIASDIKEHGGFPSVEVAFL